MRCLIRRQPLVAVSVRTGRSFLGRGVSGPRRATAGIEPRLRLRPARPMPRRGTPTQSWRAVLQPEPKASLVVKRARAAMFDVRRPRKPGEKVKQKAGLNRAILDTAPGSFINNLLVKAEEAGRCQVLLDPRKHRSWQTCPGCTVVRKKELNERDHRCRCGFESGRDQASAFRCSWTD